MSSSVNHTDLHIRHFFGRRCHIVQETPPVPPFWSNVKWAYRRGSETWSLKVDVQWFSVCKCVVAAVLVEYSGRIWSVPQSLGVRYRTVRGQSLKHVMKLNQLNWLGNVFRMPTKRLPRCTLISEVVRQWLEDWSKWSVSGMKK